MQTYKSVRLSDETYHQLKEAKGNLNLNQFIVFLLDLHDVLERKKELESQQLEHIKEEMILLKSRIISLEEHYAQK
jgi:hypothetical protein